MTQRAESQRAESESQDHTTSLEHYLAPLRDHRKVILLVTVATLALGALVALAGPQRYTARTSVLIYPVAADPTEALQGAERSDDMATELRIAESRAVAEMTATELDALGIDVGISEAAAAITVANPEDSRVLTISYQASEPATARVGSELAAAAYLAYRSELNAASRQVARTSINDEVAVLKDRLTVAEEQLAQAGAGSSARLVAEVELASIDAELEAQQDALADLSTLSIDAATVFDEANEPGSSDGLGSAQLLVGALAGGLVLGVIAAWTMAALGLPSGSLRPTRTTGGSNRSDGDDGGNGDDGDEPSDADNPFDDSDNRDPLELLKALEAVEADPAITLEPSSVPSATADAEPAHESESEPAPEPETQPTAEFPELPDVVQPAPLDEAFAPPEPIATAEPIAVPEMIAVPETATVAEPIDHPIDHGAIDDSMHGEAFDQPVPFDESPFEEPMAFEAPLTVPELNQHFDAPADVAPAAEFPVADETEFSAGFDANVDPGFGADLDTGIDDAVQAPSVTHGPLVAELQANSAVAPEDEHEDEAAVLEHDDTDSLDEVDVEVDEDTIAVGSGDDQAETEDDTEAEDHAETDDEVEASLTTGDPRELDPGPPSWDGPFVGPTTWDQLSAMAAAIGGSVEATDAEAETTTDTDTDTEQETAAEQELDDEVSAPVETATSSAAGLAATNDIDNLFEKLSQLGSSGPVAVLSLSDRNPAAGLTAGFELADELRAVGANVLLIDVRIENPVLDTLFDDGPGSGLAQVMTGDVVLAEAVRNLPGLDGLDLLTVGITDADTADHLAGPAFQRLLAEARLTYHSIVVIGDAIVASGAEDDDQEPSAEMDRARSLSAAVDALIVGTADPAGTAASDELVAVLDSFDAPTLQLVTAPVPAASGTVPEASSV